MTQERKYSLIDASGTCIRITAGTMTEAVTEAEQSLRCRVVSAIEVPDKQEKPE